VALIAWLLGAAASGPSGWALSSVVIRTVLSSNPTYEYSYWGLLAWLAVVVVIGVISSLAPAQRAALLTVRETLDYE
jgi:ABC-type lipoprotein release transport system permease subunit